MSGYFGESLASVARQEGTSFDLETLYEAAKIAMLTGWSMEYIDGLGLLHRESLLQVHDAEQHLKAKR